MSRPPYAVERTSVETVLCVAILAVALYKWSLLPTGSSSKVGAVMAHRQMIACQRTARWFGEQGMKAELRYQQAVR